MASEGELGIALLSVFSLYLLDANCKGFSWAPAGRALPRPWGQMPLCSSLVDSPHLRTPGSHPTWMVSMWWTGATLPSTTIIAPSSSDLRFKGLQKRELPPVSNFGIVPCFSDSSFHLLLLPWNKIPCKSKKLFLSPFWFSRYLANPIAPKTDYFPSQHSLIIWKISGSHVLNCFDFMSHCLLLHSRWISSVALLPWFLHLKNKYKTFLDLFLDSFFFSQNRDT